MAGPASDPAGIARASVRLAGGSRGRTSTRPPRPRSSSSGNIWLDDVRAGTVTLSASSGSILADELESSDVTAWTSSGSVDLELDGRREDYTVHMTTSSGSVSGVQPGGDGDRILTVSTSSGSINVSFTE